MFFKRKKDIRYYLKKYTKTKNINDISVFKLKSESDGCGYAIFINKGNRRAYSDWLRYIGSYDVMFLIDEYSRITRIETDIILDVSPFADGNRFNFKKPKPLLLEKSISDLTKWKELSVWNI